MTNIRFQYCLDFTFLSIQEENYLGPNRAISEHSDKFIALAQRLHLGESVNFTNNPIHFGNL